MWSSQEGHMTGEQPIKTGESTHLPCTFWLELRRSRLGYRGAQGGQPNTHLEDGKGVVRDRWRVVAR